MVQSTCSNDHAICKDLGSSPTHDHDQWSFSPVNEALTSVPCAPKNQLKAIRDTCKKQRNNKKMHCSNTGQCKKSTIWLLAICRWCQMLLYSYKRKLASKLQISLLYLVLRIYCSDTPQPAECTVCHKRFKNLPALNGHMRLHGGYVNVKKPVSIPISIV